MTNPRILAACTGGGAGDLLAALPAMSALHRHFRVPIDVLTTQYASSLLCGQASVGQIMVDDGEPLRMLAGQLAQAHYSHGVVFWSNPRIARAFQQAGIPTRVGQARRLYSFRYTKRVTVRSETGDSDSHWTDIQMDYARALGAQPVPSDYATTIMLTQSDMQEADALIKRTVGDRAFVIFHAARGITAHAARWPSDHFAAVSDALARALTSDVLLTGSDKEAALVAQTAAAMREPAFNVCGQTSLRGFAALAKRATVVVALDSGPMHIAANVGAPTVGIFALRTDRPNRWRPLGPRVATVGPAYACPPRCRKETCKTFACYAALDAARVVAATRSLIRSADTAAAS
jgi:ADP-heptose:LPS heptosyltransferase